MALPQMISAFHADHLDIRLQVKHTIFCHQTVQRLKEVWNVARDSLIVRSSPDGDMHPQPFVSDGLPHQVEQAGACGVLPPGKNVRRPVPAPVIFIFIYRCQNDTGGDGDPVVQPLESKVPNPL